MNEGLRESAILWEVEPKGAGPFSGGSLTVQPFQIGIVIRDGEVVDVFESGKRNLPRRGEVRTYVASTTPFNLTFDLKDPFGASAQGRGAVLDQLVLTEDREVVTGSIDLTLRVVRENVDHLLKLLGPGGGIVTQQHVSDRIKTELQAKVLALDISKFTAKQLLGSEELFRNMYESVEVEMNSSIRFYGLRLDNFYPNWGVTHEDLKKIMQQAQELDEIAGSSFSPVGNEPAPEVPPPGHGGPATASYYTPPQAGTFAPGQSIEHKAGNPMGTAEVSDFEQESSGPSVTVVAVGVLVASALLVAAFFLAPQIFAGVFLLGLIATISGVFLDKDAVRNIGIVVLATGIVGMLVAAAFPLDSLG